MISGEYWQVMDDEALARIDAGAMRLLTKGGSRIEHEGIRAMLEAAGCTVDHSSRRVRFSEKLVREAVGHFGGRAPLTLELPAGWSPRLSISHSGSNPHILDWPSGERRLATLDDARRMAKMAHVLDEFDTVGRVFTCSDLDPRIEPLRYTLELARITDKRIGDGEIFYPHYIEPLVRMGEVLSGKKGDNSLIAACDFFIQPLILEPLQAACMIEKRKVGCKLMPGTMAVAGISCPITIASVVTLSLAELLAGWTIGYLLNPEVEAGGIVATGTMDMRTMNSLFGSPEAMMQNIATANAARRLYGIEVEPILHYVDCKRPGLEAAFQKMFALVGAPFAQVRIPGTNGLLSAGQDYSPVQHLLENEMAKAVERFWGSFEVDEETQALDLILSKMDDASTNFLETGHTMDYFRSEHWYPTWMDRSLWRGQTKELESESAMLARISAYVEDAIARYEEPAIDRAKIAELERILAAANSRLS